MLRVGIHRLSVHFRGLNCLRHLPQLPHMASDSYAIVGLQLVNDSVSEATTTSYHLAVFQLLATKVVLKFSQVRSYALLDMTDTFFFDNGDCRAI